MGLIGLFKKNDAYIFGKAKKTESKFGIQKALSSLTFCKDKYRPVSHVIYHVTISMKIVNNQQIGDSLQPLHLQILWEGKEPAHCTCL